MNADPISEKKPVNFGRRARVLACGVAAIDAGCIMAASSRYDSEIILLGWVKEDSMDGWRVVTVFCLLCVF
jgi:hypothetical protein